MNSDNTIDQVVQLQKKLDCNKDELLPIILHLRILSYYFTLKIRVFSTS